ncbi:MAG: ATP-binding protein [Deltaproteobacteria bacterium]|nr:ATP-binding protein [Deltaproteobacteria bacterium]MBW2343812.1 ATP-binding protein [Deltaproteobacteria bacterium]
MQFKLNDIEEIAAKFTDSETGIHRDLILLAGLPGTGKTTVAKEFARQTQALHFDIDEVKRVVVPADEVTEDIDPPEYRFKYYAETIRRLPELFAKTSAQTVILDETFHLRNFRDFWNESARALNIRVHWIEVVCDEEIVKERLSIGKNRGNHILGNKAIPMYLLFKEAFEPMKAPYEVVDTSKDVIPQIQRIIEKQAIGEKQ